MGKKWIPQSVPLNLPIFTVKTKYNFLITLKADRKAFENRKHALQYDPRAAVSILNSIEVILQALNAKIQSIQEEVFIISDEESRHIKDLMQSVAGIWEASSQAILLATNELKNFQNVNQLSKFLGICTSNKRSDSSVYGKTSIVKSSHNIVRSILFMAARSAKKHNNACREIYIRLRANGKAHKVALMAVVHKLLKQVFAVVKNDVLFDNLYTIAKWYLV